MARTGSYMLSSALNSHPLITCFGELLKRNPLTDIDLLDFPQRCGDSANWIERRHEQPIEFVDAVIAHTGDSPCVGFKLMIPQSPTMLDHIGESNDWRVVLLRRDNTLASFASGQIARATGQGVALAGDTVVEAKAVFDEAAFETFARRRRRFFDSARERLGRGRYFEIEYRHACRPEGLAEVLDYLGIDASISIAPTTVRRSKSSSVADRFENPDEVRAYAKRVGSEEWL